MYSYAFPWPRCDEKSVMEKMSALGDHNDVEQPQPLMLNILFDGLISANRSTDLAAPIIQNGSDLPEGI